VGGGGGGDHGYSLHKPGRGPVKVTIFSGALNASSLPCGKSVTSFFNLSVGEYGTLTFSMVLFYIHICSCNFCHIIFLDVQ
jgi:hypothetical protein